MEKIQQHLVDTKMFTHTHVQNMLFLHKKFIYTQPSWFAASLQNKLDFVYDDPVAWVHNKYPEMLPIKSAHMSLAVQLMYLPVAIVSIHFTPQHKEKNSFRTRNSSVFVIVVLMLKSGIQKQNLPEAPQLFV